MTSFLSRASTAVLVSAILSSIIGPVMASAQEKVSLKVQPSLIEEKVDAGQVIQKAAEVTNFSTVAQTLYVSVRNITTVTADGQPVFAGPGETTPYDVSSWLSFSLPSFTLQPGESRQVPLTIAVPQSVSPGGHYGAIIFSQNPPELKSSGTGVGYEVALLLSLRVSGDIREEAQVRDFSTGKFIYGKTPIDFTAHVENPGNVIVRPRGPVDIVNMFGKKVDTIRMNDTEAAIFPGVTRQFDVEWESQDLHFGRYAATLVLAYGQEKKQSTTPIVVRFWILPTNIIIPAAVFFIFFILLTWILMRLYVARRLRELSAYGAKASVSGGTGMSRTAAVTIALLASIIIMLGVLFLFF